MRVAATTLQRGYFGNFDERIEAFLARAWVDYLATKKRRLFLIAEFQGGIRGGLIAIPRSYSEAYMPAFVVDILFVCKSIGTTLLETAVLQLRELGYSTLSTVAPRDPDGNSFFKHKNWEHVGIRNIAEVGLSHTLDEWRLTL
jgi:hypothetical protein